MRKQFVLIAGFLILFLVAACSSSKETGTTDTKAERTEKVNKTGMPIVEDEISLDFFAGQAAQSAPNWNDVMLFNEYEKMTNIDIEWEMVPSTGLAEKRNLTYRCVV
ncbi:hypothetical protein J14TS2_05040 [Bacillus sp. J14TS2]|uniref:hypothetical protein n=1 Tax=Bacillus sp. J14TS2 TaxID=2807188 RepID=UPI001B2544FD|nr:hypothetical protein [Bacillus sp. J14TS2]GIN70029.1 hypothetical protein J14TS2_05040 [Bacillus sp. J14TS2]